MSFYGKQWKIDGVICGGIRRDYGVNGQYVLTFERCFAALEDIEAINWVQPTVKWMRTGGPKAPEGLPKGYGFEVADIRYLHNTQAYEVTVRTAAQYLGDVTAYQAEVDALTTRCETLTAEKDQLSAALQEADETVIALYEAAAQGPEPETAPTDAPGETGASESGEVNGA